MRCYIGEHSADGPVVWVVQRSPRPELTEVVAFLSDLRRLSEDVDLAGSEWDAYRADVQARKADLIGRIEAAESVPKPVRLVPRGVHSPDGFDWGYAGSGPADLAMSILQAELGEAPPPAVYLRFRDDVIARLLPHHFELSASSVWNWIEANRRLVEVELFEKLPSAATDVSLDVGADGPALSVTDQDAPAVVADTAPTASALVAACEAAWSDIQRHHPDLPDVVIVLGSGVERGRLVKLGHWWGGRWIADGETRGEVLLAGEALHLPPDKVFEVLLHEAAHGLNAARGIRDTSRGGRYHNQRFKEAAEEVGLRVRAMPPYGLAATELGAAAEQRYESTITGLGDAMRIARQLDGRVGAGREDDGYEWGGRGGGAGDKSGDERSTGSQAAVCGCGRRIRMAPSVLAAGPVVCGLCGAEFTQAGAYVAGPPGAEMPDHSEDVERMPARFSRAVPDGERTVRQEDAVLAVLERRRDVLDAAIAGATESNGEPSRLSGLMERRNRLTGAITELRENGRARPGEAAVATFGDTEAVLEWGQRFGTQHESPMPAATVEEADRRERLARALLKADGTLTAPVATAAKREFQAGDRVVEVVDPVDAPHGGVLGTVQTVDPAAGAMDVDFATLGRVRLRLEDSLAEVLRHDYTERADVDKASAKHQSSGPDRSAPSVER